MFKLSSVGFVWIFVCHQMIASPFSPFPSEVVRLCLFTVPCLASNNTISVHIFCSDRDNSRLVFPFAVEPFAYHRRIDKFPFRLMFVTIHSTMIYHWWQFANGQTYARRTLVCGESRRIGKQSTGNALSHTKNMIKIDSMEFVPKRNVL